MQYFCTSVCVSKVDWRHPKTRKEVSSMLLSNYFFCPVSLCTREFLCIFKSEFSVFPQPCGAPAIKLHCPSKLNAFRTHLPGAGPLGWQACVGLRTLIPVGESLQYNYFPVCGSPGAYRIDYIMSQLLLLVSLWFLFDVCRCGRSFLVGSSLFHWWFFCR